jgi:hypothetical protein
MALHRLSYLLAMCCGGKRYSASLVMIVEKVVCFCVLAALCEAEAARAGFSAHGNSSSILQLTSSNASYSDQSCDTRITIRTG